VFLIKKALMLACHGIEVREDMSNGELMHTRDNFCLYFGPAAERIAQGWRPAGACSREPGTAGDHVQYPAPPSNG
jgi:hypothetical protein